MTFNKLLTAIKSLTTTDKNKLISYLTGNCNKSGKVADYINDQRFNDGRYCVHCGCNHIVRNGHTKSGIQKYVCKNCGKSFSPTTKTIAYKSKLDINIYSEYIDCMMMGLTIRDAAERCGIHRNTSFRLRHKILDALQNMAEGVTLNGIVEADEKFFDISYKGNHKYDGFTMPRKVHKRGRQSTKRGLSRDKVCVPCAMNRNGLSIAKISSLGKASLDTISNVLDGRIKEDSVLCTDGEKSYILFSESNHLNHISLKTGRSKNGIYNIQRINNYHSQLERFMSRFNGVSTKYLNNYLIWHNLVNIAKEGYSDKKNIFLNFVLTTDKISYGCNLSNRPALPLIA